MLSPKSLTLPPLLVMSLLAAPACAHKAPTFQTYPPAADLQVSPKPRLSAEALSSSEALNRHNIAIEMWGEGLARQVGRLCRWAEAGGMPDINCPPPDS